MSENYWAERQQNRRLAGLEEDLSYVSASLSQARASQNRLKAELSKVSGSLEQRLNRLSAAFDAFVEISDLRVTLGLFDTHGRVRHQARQLLAGEPVIDVADAEGYWLAPALVALRGVADGAVDDETLSLALARDPLRAKAFHVLLAGVHRSQLPALADVLPALSESVPRYQRAVWLLAADGFAGPAEWARCAALLSESVDDRLADTLRSVAAPRTALTVPKELDGGGDLATALQACEKLTALRAWVTTTLTAYTAEPAAAVDPLVRRTLDLLIDEGSPVELPLLARERELRAVIEGKDAASTTWDSPVGTVADLLREDLTAELPDRRALAVRASAPVLLSVAEKFEAAARTEPPQSLAVRTRYGQVTITQTAADQASLRKAEDTVVRVSAVESKRREIAYGAAVVAAAFAVLAVVAGWGWAFVAVTAAGVGIYQWLTHGAEQRKAAETAVESTEALRKDIAGRVETFAKTRRELQDRQARVTDDMAALREALTTVTR
jgi:hypothetical protein